MKRSNVSKVTIHSDLDLTGTDDVYKRIDIEALCLMVQEHEGVSFILVTVHRSWDSEHIVDLLLYKTRVLDMDDVGVFDDMKSEEIVEKYF